VIESWTGISNSVVTSLAEVVCLLGELGNKLRVMRDMVYRVPETQMCNVLRFWFQFQLFQVLVRGTTVSQVVAGFPVAA
jgi:hypothetical protein